jgi:glucosyl-dolichyl phosphate glucuronosyltransferase
MTPELSIVIATRNRAPALSRCLEAVARMDASFPFETIVVDNGSSDETRAIVDDSSRRLPGLQYHFEPEPGASRARNRGIAAVRSPVLVFLDDDAEPTIGWLSALHRALAESEAAAVGGPILARFEVEPPDWLAGILRVLSAQDFGAARRLIAAPPYLFGGNLAVRRADLEKIGGFDESLGPRGKTFFLGEDTDICERLIDVGRTLLYEPKAIVYHWVGEERFVPSYLRQRALGTGRSVARKMRRRVPRAAFARALAAKTAKLPLHLAVWVWARLLAERETAILRERSMLVTLGILSESLRGERRPENGRPPLRR